MFLIALAAGIICAIIVMAYFIAIDQYRISPAATNGSFGPRAARPTLIKQFEAFARPFISRLPSEATIRVRHKLSRAGDPGGLTPAGFQAVRYSLAALMAIAGLGLGVLLALPVPVILVAPATGIVFAVAGYFLPLLWLEQRISARRHQIQRSLAEATDLLTLVVESGMSLDEGMLSITERFHNALGDEIGKVLREIRLGRPRMAALEQLPFDRRQGRADGGGGRGLGEVARRLSQDRAGVDAAVAFPGLSSDRYGAVHE